MIFTSANEIVSSCWPPLLVALLATSATLAAAADASERRLVAGT
ncbi:MAG: hypothetical protein U1F50_13690 [Rubrivivax sp.]